MLHDIYERITHLNDEIYKESGNTLFTGVVYNSIRVVPENLPNDTNVYFASSFSKPVTALAVAVAYEKGLICFEQNLSDFFQIKNGELITISHLLNHTDGLHDLLSAIDLFDVKINNDQDAVEFVAGFNSVNYNPGEKFLYSNTGYFLLARILEKATGQLFSDFVNKAIFTKLDMLDSEIGGVGSKANSNKIIDISGPIGLYISFSDILKFEESFQRFHQGIISRKTFDKVFYSGEEPYRPYCMGFYHQQTQGELFLSCPAEYNGFRGEIRRLQEYNLTIISLTKNDLFAMDSYLDTIMDICLEKDRVKQTPLDISVKVAQNVDIEGVYFSQNSIDILKVLKKNNKYIAFMNGYSFYLKGMGNGKYVSENLPYKLELDFTVANNHSGLILYYRYMGFISFRKIDSTSDVSIKMPSMEGNYSYNKYLKFSIEKKNNCFITKYPNGEGDILIRIERNIFWDGSYKIELNEIDSEILGVWLTTGHRLNTLYFLKE